MPPHSEQIVSRICGALFRGSLVIAHTVTEMTVAPAASVITCRQCASAAGYVPCRGQLAAT
ncbi:hypothetical protein BRM98_06080 [Xanthomonas oryzae pv. oryzae]|nr:hypothetical protein BRL70_14185 [Xanthomonas oryzae pv. oryzae]RBF28562.1 hypothetical protein BRM98_06080 [Xanthomonas oryzae pv. oryzae]